MSGSAIWSAITAPGVPTGAFWTAVIVGTILNGINQGDAFWTGAPVDWFKAGLTYVVPYCVFTFGAVKAQRRARQGS